LAETPPEATPETMAAAHCWRWCGGWEPGRWPAYAALHEVEDWGLLMDLMEHIRDNI